jgi:hypothetical protein
MATPNIVGVTTIAGRTLPFSLSDTSVTVLITNPAASGKSIKVNMINVANDQGTSSADISIFYHGAAAGGGTAYKIASTVAVPADSALVVVDKASSFYLEEDRSLTAQASAAGYLDVVVSYEEIWAPTATGL